MENQIIQQPKEDFAHVDFGDKRLNKRLQIVVENSTKNAEKSILGSGKGRSEAKAFYRLLGNDKFDTEELLVSAASSTFNRMSGTVLLVQDTMDLNLNGHNKTKGLGFSSEHVRGIKVHNCIALSPEGLSYGLMYQSYESRPEAKSPLTQAEKAARLIEEKESYRWIETLKNSTSLIPEDTHFITICDREGDFYELYAEATELGEDFIIRVTHDRCSDTDKKIMSKIRGSEAAGTVMVNIPRDSRKGVAAREAELEIAYCEVKVKKPSTVRNKELSSQLTINLVRITELNPPGGQKPIEWILATSLPLADFPDAMKVVEYYIQRWKIERFHFILKSGMGAEKIQQRTYERIKPVLLIYSVIALFIMTITYMGRVLPDTPCNLFLDDDEWKILYRVVHKSKKSPNKPYTMAEAVAYLGELGGYKRAPSDGPPGLQSIWNGLFALYFAVDILLPQIEI
jgi:hypothetical protein